MQIQPIKKFARKGNLYATAVGIVGIFVLLFAAIFLMSKLIATTALNESDALYTTQTTLTTNFGTVVSVLIIVVIIILMAIAVRSFGGFGGQQGGGAAV